MDSGAEAPCQFLNILRGAEAPLSHVTRPLPRRSLASLSCIALSYIYNFMFRRRSAFVITETELKLMAAAAKMGLSRTPKNG
jgi:hypothetical protein